MEGYRQRTIAELLKKTYKLNRPRMTPILEGKDRMQGPLDNTDAGMDFASLQVCGNCRNHLDATIAQNCGICNRGYHSFCLEAPLNSSEDRSLQCCYYCQHQVPLGTNQPGPSSEDAHNKLSEDGMDVCRSNENVQDCDEPGMSYDASELSPVTKRMDLAWNDGSPSKRSADSEATIFDTLYKVTKTRAARKLGIRRKRILDSSGNDDSNSQVLSSDTDTLRPALESSGADVLKEVGRAMSTCPEAGVEGIKEHGSAAVCIADLPTANAKMKSDPGEDNGDQLLETNVVFPNKDAKIAIEEIPAGDVLIKEGIVTGAIKMIGSPKIDVAIMARPVYRNVDMLSEDRLMGSCINVSAISGALPSEIREEMQVVRPLISRDSEGHPPLETANVVAQMVVEDDAVSERQSAMQKQPDFAEQPKEDDDARRVSARLISNTLCDTDVPAQNTTGEGTVSPTACTTPAIAKNKSSCLALEGQDEDDKIKPLIFVDVRGTLPPIREEPDEHYYSDGLANKAVCKEELPPKEYLSSKAHMDIDSILTGSEINHAASLDSPNDRDAMEDDSKVCDICGDAGYEGMLAICSECNGAEHVYCYQNLMAQVPEGYWQCDRCRSKQKAGDFRPSTDVRSVSSLPTRLPSFNSTKKHGSVGNARSRLSALLQKRRLPSEKKRAMKGVPSSQFPAKRGIVENAADAPPAKKQAMDVSSLPYMPSSKLGLSREGPFKIPDTGKIKFVSHTALMGTSSEGTSPFSRGNSKSPLSSGSPSSIPLNCSPAQSGQTSKARFLSASNAGVGTGSVKVNTANQLNVASSSAPLVTSGLKNSGALKSSESLPSFLLTLKSTSSKPQLSSKGLREATDSICQQSLSKEGFSSQAGIANTRVLSKTSSFKLSKASNSGGAVEPKSKNDANLESAKPSGSKLVHPEVGLMKSAENKHEVGSINILAENRSKAVAPSETHVPLEMHNGVYNSYKLIRHDVGGSLQVTNLPLKDETVLVASGTSEAHQIPVLSSSIKDAQDLSIEQDKNLGFKVASPVSLARQTSKLSEQVGPDISKEVSKTSADEVQWAGLLPCPVIVVQEAPTFKAEENKALQLAVNVDAVGEKSPSALIDKAPTHDDNRSSFTPRSRSFGAWGSPSYVPSLGSTRCYRCKELGHSAKNCNNRSSMPCISSEAAGAFKAVLPATNVDSSTSVLKGVVPTYSMDNAMRIVQNVVEVAPKIKLTTEMAPIIKPLSTERVLASVQILNPVVGEAQAQMNEGQILENIVPLALPVPHPLVDQQIRKDTMAHKQIITDSGLTLTQVIVSGVDNTDDTTEIAGGTKQEDMTLVCPMNPTNVSISSGTQLMTSSAECQSPVFSVPSTPKNAAHLSAALGSLSSADVKATTPFVSRYQESLKVYPEAQIVWQGTFEVAGKAKPQVSFHGLQANPSNRAVAKVRKVAKKLHPLVPLEELPRGSEHDSWPVQFQKSPPINDNIALYFFASSKESYVQYYKPLVDRLIKFDFTLKGSIEDAELLIFPSNLLPPGSQCWNNFMFLWAVFRPRKIPIKPPNIPYESKQSGSDGAFRLPLQSGVLTWGRGEDVQIDTIGNKNIEILHVTGSKPETPISNIAEGAIIVGPSVLSDPDVVCEQQQPCQQELQHLTQVDALVKERFEPNAQTDPILSQSEKAVATLLSSTQESIDVVKSQPLSRSLPPVEGGLGLDASNESSQIPSSSSKLEEKVDTSNKLVAPSTAKVSSALLRSEHGSTEKAKHSTPLMGTSPAVMVCPSPRDRQEDPWTARKLSSHSPAGHQDKDKGVRERINDKSDRMETGKGVSRDRDREKPRDRDKHKERDRDRDRSRRHSDWEREKERDRGKERERDRDRDRDRDRGRERERDRERWRDREERDRRGRDWDRDRDKVGERDKGRERGREREAERERVVLRDRSSRHRHWEPSEADYGRSGRHWHRYPRSRTPSRSPPVNRDWSPSRPRLDRYCHRYRRSSRHSRSYSPSPDSDHGVGRIQPRAESRELSKDSFAHKGKSPDIVVGDSRAKEESAVKTSAVKDLGGDEAGNFSQRGSNSNSLCREKTAGMERKLPIADLNLSPSEIEGNEEGNEDDVTMSVEVAMPLNASPDDHTSGCQDFFPPIGGSGSNEEPGECSISAGKIANSRSTEHLICVDGRNDSLSHSLMNDSSGPSLFPLNMSLEGSSSCLHFFPQATNDDERVPSAPDLNLALGAKEQSLPQTGELPLFMQLLKPCQESSRLGTLNPLLDVPMASEQADLSLSLAIPEHSKRPVVNTSLRLFG